jgi:hypothetical protein
MKQFAWYIYVLLRLKDRKESHRSVPRRASLQWQSSRFVARIRQTSAFCLPPVLQIAQCLVGA